MSAMERASSSSYNHNTRTVQPNKESVGKQVLETLQLTGDIFLLTLKFWWLIAEAVFRLIVPVPEKSVKGKIVLITGAGHGIGKELALQYASQGARVVCWDINKKDNLETRDEILRMGYTKAYAYVCNVANRQQVMETAEKVLKEIGAVDILINNAGIMPCHPFLDHTTEEIERITDINLMAHYWTLQAFLPTMLKRNQGHVVAISSVAGLMGFRNLVPYCASKFAVRGLMEALFQDLHTDPECQVKLTLIYPHGVDTGLCKRPKLRFPNLLALMDPRLVARQIIRAQRRELLEATIPRPWLTLLYSARLFPAKALIQLNDFVDSYVDSDL